VDLNLFRVFDAMMKHRSVSGASRELGVTASAVSHALARLRKLLGDELFVLGGDGMQPTARAVELAPNVGQGLERLASAIAQRAFDPTDAVRTFGIGTTDLGGIVVLPALMQRLGSRAPKVNLRIFPLSRNDAVQQLDDGRLDLIFGWFRDLPSRVQRRPLFTEREAIVVRRGHPLCRQAVTRQRLFAFPHVVVELGGSGEHDRDGFVDERGVERRTWIERLLIETAPVESALIARVAATVPSYSLVPPILAVTDMIATLPEKLARLAVERDGLVMLDLPYEPLSVLVEMIWHERAIQDPSVRWVIEQISAVVADFSTSDSLTH
jgi:DNA-binding transcriptional LysR family regulator